MSDGDRNATAGGQAAGARDQGRGVRVHVDETDVADVFANAFRTDASGEEVFVNFGINRLLPGPQDQGPQVLFKPSTRVIMTYPTAKRLAIMLTQLLRDLEGQFGQIELDIDKRRIGPPPRAGAQVRIFLSGKGVEIDKIDDPKFDVKGQARKVLDAGGEFLACGTCLELRESEGSEVCPLSTLKDQYELVRDSDKVVTV
jgi:uncharacterized protein involved in oxidation of intracellular sulfur